MSVTTIEKSLFLAAPKQTVWDFLTDKDKLATWFFKSEENLAEGKPFKLTQNKEGEDVLMCWGEVHKMDAPNRLEYSFTINPLNGNMTNVVWVLEDALGGTKLSLTHSGIDKAAGDAALSLMMGLDSGWEKHFGALREAIK